MASTYISTSCVVVGSIRAVFAWMSRTPANAASPWFSHLAMVHVIAMTPRLTSSLCGSHQVGVRNPFRPIWPQHFVVHINAPSPELTVPSVVQIVHVEVRRYVWLDADFLNSSRPEHMTARVALKLGLVTSALTGGWAKGDSLLFWSSVVTLNVLGSHIDLPLIPKCVHFPAAMTLGLLCFLVQMSLHLLGPWLVQFNLCIGDGDPVCKVWQGPVPSFFN